jgi:hypothetical protein
MRKKMLFLALVLTALAASVPALRADSDDPPVFCPQNCVTYADGSQCCTHCWCDASGVPVACTQNICPPAGGGGVHD